MSRGEIVKSITGPPSVRAKGQICSMFSVSLAAGNWKLPEQVIFGLGRESSNQKLGGILPLEQKCFKKIFFSSQRNHKSDARNRILPPSFPSFIYPSVCIRFLCLHPPPSYIIRLYILFLLFPISCRSITSPCTTVQRNQGGGIPPRAAVAPRKRERFNNRWALWKIKTISHIASWHYIKILYSNFPFLIVLSRPVFRFLRIGPPPLFPQKPLRSCAFSPFSFSAIFRSVEYDIPVSLFLFLLFLFPPLAFLFPPPRFLFPFSFFLFKLNSSSLPPFSLRHFWWGIRSALLTSLFLLQGETVAPLEIGEPANVIFWITFRPPPSFFLVSF